MNVQSINVTNKNQNPNFSAKRIPAKYIEDLRTPSEICPDQYSLRNKILSLVYEHKIFPADKATKIKELMGDDDILLNNQEQIALNEVALSGDVNKTYETMKDFIRTAVVIPLEQIADSLKQIKTYKSELERQKQLTEEAIENVRYNLINQ